MNYFEHHIGDYAAATAHLSLLEDAVYSRLLRRYYLQEEPLPAEVCMVARLVGARAAEEVEAVQVVLEEFFTLQEDGWHNKRADEEIARYQAKVDAARENGKRGGRPPKNPEVSTEKAKETQPFSLGSISETQPKAHQTPDTSNQAEKQKQERSSPSGSRLPADWGPSSDDIAFAERERPDVDWWAEAEKFRDYWHGIPGAKGRKSDWPGTWRNWIRRADSKRQAPRAGPQQQPLGKTAQALMALEDFGNGGLDQAGNRGGPQALDVLGPGAHAGSGGYPTDRRRLA
ncbi:YdaU family protein [Xanthomonas oryzae pv. oryzicola]|uniref:YdaU family protein n=1 Tax=Xanthomonas oryzae TaxID=347 RepID=UPI0009EC25A9|nr:YdaU family protein [Xanthomonas oryzae]OWB26840.1 hypothetical protein XocBAI21_17420 [Xanthomonas oryzae pv. oryzicola]UWI58146.1 YdaU family protein [Xanthomonas oryzae pv. oryzae]